MAGYISSLGFGGSPATTSIVNAYSGGGVSSGAVMSASVSQNTKEVLSGALTANTLATILSVSGRGEVPILNAYTKDNTSRTVRLQVIVDGTTVFDSTSSAIINSGYGVIAAGKLKGATASEIMDPDGSPIRFNASLLVKIASSLTETDKVAISYQLKKS